MIPGAPIVFSGPCAVASRGGTAPDLATGNNKHWANPSHRMRAPRVHWQPMRPTEWRHGLPVPPTTPMPVSLDAIVAEDPLIVPLMNGIVFYPGHRYDISPLDIAVLRDVGPPLEALFADGFD